MFRELDSWLRSDGNRRNPGTTADLVAATLFAGLRGGKLPLSAQVTGDIVSATGVDEHGREQLAVA